MGIGSLILQQGDGKGRRLDMNMVVPIGLLAPIMRGSAQLWPGEPAGAALARHVCHRSRTKRSSSAASPTTVRPSRRACAPATRS